jgi:endonuclease-3
VELALLQRVPERWRLHAHHWLILHGRHVCKARAPLCPGCVIRDLCRYPGKVLPPGPFQDQPPGQPQAQPPRQPARRQRQPRA